MGERGSKVAVPMRRVSRNRDPLCRADFDAAERGFLKLLRRKRFSPAFIDRHAGDVLARARFEYSRRLAAGDEVDNPVGWIIHCAWRRTQNVLEQKGSEPQLVSIENGGAFAADTATPEEEVVETDLHRRLQDAIAELPLEERKVIALTYFQEMSVREASRTLRWDKCKADRRHRAALAHLRELLGVEDADGLQVEIGLAAWLSVETGRRAGVRLDGPLGAGLDTLSRGAVEIASRAQETARRLLVGGAAEPGVGAAAGGAARAAGVCGAAVVLVCGAASVVGPGIGGGVQAVGERDEAPAKAKPRPKPHSEPAAPALSTAVPEPPSPQPATASRSASRQKKKASTTASSAQAETTTSSPTAASSRQVAEEFDPFVTPEPETSSTPSPAPAEENSASGGSDSSGGSPPPRASGRQVEAEFGL